MIFFTKKFFFSEKGFYLCTAKPQGTHSGCSAVGSVQRSGRWGRQFESGHSDQVQKTALKKGGFFVCCLKIVCYNNKVWKIIPPFIFRCLVAGAN